MLALDAIAERRIREAQARGEFDDLPGAGRPLELGDDSLVPEDLRAAYRLLRNTGYLPPDLEAHREIEQLLLAAASETERSSRLSQISFLLSRCAVGRRHDILEVRREYLQKPVEHSESCRNA